MAIDNNTPSFIPKQQDRESAQKHIGKIRSYLNAALFVGVTVFILAVAAAVFSFLFKNLAIDELSQSKERLNEARDQFQPNEIADLNRFNERLQAVDQLLDGHRQLEPLLNEVEKYVLQAVQLRSADFEFESKDVIKVSGSGEALNYESLALQSDEFTKSSYISNPIFSNFQQNTEGLVSFQYSFKVDSKITQPLQASGGAVEKTPLVNSNQQEVDVIANPNDI